MNPAHLTARRGWWIVFLVVGCESETDFRAQLASFQVQVRADVARSRACADELRAVAARSPVAATRALTEVPRLFVSRASMFPEGSRKEIARQEREIAAASEIISRATIDGPAALDRVVAAVATAHRIEARLCQARDVASLAAIERVAPDEAVAREGATNPARGDDRAVP